MNEATLRLLTLCALRVGGKSLDWSLLARASLAGHLDDLWSGHVPASEPGQVRATTSALLNETLPLRSEARERVLKEVDVGIRAGASLITVLDPDFPKNLAQVRDLPPFLFVVGRLQPTDDAAIAIVGTRQATDEGLRRAGRLSTELSSQGYTVVSGLARGIDTRAHEAALRSGGRTVAVLGTGVTHCYPAENKALANQIVRDGALVSQFWPTRAPGRDTFPRRNRVTSGISLGSAVVEASSTSGAKMQARLAHEHGKRVWLLASLVSSQPWAQKMVELGRARVVHTTDDILDDLRSYRESPGPLPVQEPLELL